jgi:hypothetical protein
MMIAFPPCTHLAVSGARHFEQKRKDGRQQKGIEFFMRMLNAPIPLIAVENPIGIISGDYIGREIPELNEKYNFPIKPTQIIHPYHFGDPYSKSTCLWLKNLKPLIYNKKNENIKNFIGRFLNLKKTFYYQSNILKNYLFFMSIYIQL